MVVNLNTQINSVTGIYNPETETLFEMKGKNISQNTQILSILVADDHYANRLLAKTLLLREGHEVTLANNGKMCLTLCEASAFDLIVLDIQMPIMDGLTALKHIRASENINADKPIFALTAYSDPEDIRAYLKAGFNHVLPKPLKPGDIHDAWRHFKSQEKHEIPHQKQEPPLQRLSTYTSTPRLQKTHMEAGFNAILVQDIPLIETAITADLCSVTTVQQRRQLLNVFWSEICDLVSEMHAQKKNIERPTLEASSLNILGAFRKNAHTIKGTCINVGALRLSRLAAQLQNAPQKDIDPLFHALGQALNLSEPALRKAFNLPSKSKPALDPDIALPTTAAG